jgi:hypothetical protein
LAFLEERTEQNATHKNVMCVNREFFSFLTWLGFLLKAFPLEILLYLTFAPVSQVPVLSWYF